MSDYRETLDELFVTKLGFEFSGLALPVPIIPGSENILNISKEYSANGIEVIVTECKDRIPEFQKQVIKAHKRLFPNSHFLFISNGGKVFDLYNVSTAQRLKPITYNEIERNTRLFKEKIQLFNVDEAQGTVDLKIKIEKAFDTNDRVTKKFFDRFEKIHKKLQSAITGIKDDADVSWYASVLLNRIMFIYFLQKHSVIQSDTNFLLTKFAEVEKNEEDYYKDFLLPLFFVGFAKRDKHAEKKAFTQKFGAVRYLNGGLFYPHHIEEKYSKLKVYKEEKGNVVPDIVEPDIEVDAATLKEILEFLNGYTWYLDSRPMKDEKDINPDVLGYIFEKYINQKELGAYYTKDDITDYIARNTIIPFIFDKLRNNGHNAPDPNPLITDNKDIKQSIADYIENTDDYSTLKFLYKEILLPLSVLDPAVGSGAFLFAALNILLPVYQKTVFKLKQHRKKQKDEWLQNLCNTLEQHSEEYYLTKQIILNNLFGVDIVEEATEICKLRLFLQLASHLPDIQAIEPLPDIDFNIYSGNSLVGGLSWEDLQATYGMKLFDKEGEKINLEQIKKDITNLSEKKLEYRSKQQEDIEETDLKILKNAINRLEVKINNSIDINVKTKPTHWFIEFNDIISKGGFDIIIGNPPYVEYNTTKNIQGLKNYSALSCGNLYAYFFERSFKMLSPLTRVGFIVPMPSINTNRMEPLQNMIRNYTSWISSFDERPSGLFEGVDQRLSIILLSNSKKKVINTTGIIRWYAQERNELFSSILTGFVSSKKNLERQGRILKFKDKIEESIFEKFSKHQLISTYISSYKTDNLISFRSAGGRYWKIFLNTEFPTKSLSNVGFYLLKKYDSEIFTGVLNSSLFWWYYSLNFDMYNLKNYMVHGFKFDFPESENPIKNKLKTLGHKLILDIDSNKEISITNSKTRGQVETVLFKVLKSKPVIDEIDSVLAQHYGFTNEEKNFIINYDLRFRMGGEEE